MKIDPKSSAIPFRNWRIYAPIATIANQYDNKSRMLRVEGNLPEGYRWDMLVRCGGDHDIIHLSDLPAVLNEGEDTEKTKRGVGALLTSAQLSKSGTYELQLRATDLDDLEVTRHTNVISVRIPETIIGDGTWPETPPSFSEIEQNILEANAHPPIPGADGYWQIWDSEADEYVPSTFPLPAATSGASIIDVSISDDDEMIVKYSDGTAKNLGKVSGQDGQVYVPHISDHKILSFTVESEPTDVPEPVDLNPNDEWADIDGGSSDYIWEPL